MERTDSEETIPSTLGDSSGFIQINYSAGLLPPAEKLLKTLDIPLAGEFLLDWQVVWSDINKAEKLYSPEFICGGVEWRLLVFPNGNRPGLECISVFLECASAARQDNPRFASCASFLVMLRNYQTDQIRLDSHEASHRFTKKDGDWGFSNFAPHKALSKIIQDDKFIFTVVVKVYADELGTLWHKFEDWDSKAETGTVGIKNQGATCYLNSLIQSLYYTNYFRRATYQIPTADDEPTKSVAYALQRLFYYLQFSPEAVSTHELTRAFGWDTMDAFHQHDVQELNRVLQDNLENTMKGTPAEGAIKKLFTGKMKSYIKCVNVDYESSRVEEYYDIQLNVKGCKNLYESFVDYCKVEMLDGDNKYDAGEFKLQDAKKGVIFESFPPVLHLQLKRFDYDMMQDQFIKINDRHEFPLEIDLSEFLHEKADRSVKPVYKLQGLKASNFRVLVHSGDLNAGHYFALIRPEKNGKWFKYDDDRVTPASLKDVLDANFGGEPHPLPNSVSKPIKSRFYTNAYMLVYIRESAEEEILSPVREEEIPAHLLKRVKLDDEEAKARQQEEIEKHLYMQVLVVVDNAYQNFNGFDIGFSSDSNFAASVKVKKDMVLGELRILIANELQYKPEQIQLWNVISRQNKTLRVDNVYSTTEMLTTSLFDIQVKSGKPSEPLKFFARTSSSEIQPGVFFEPKGNKILIFLKKYDPYTATLSLYKTIYVNPDSLICDLYAHIEGGSSNILYEEVKPGMVERCNPESTLQDAELLEGDILVFQQEVPAEDLNKVIDPSLINAPAYYELVANRVVVEFHPKDKTNEYQAVTFSLDKRMSYEQVSVDFTKVVEALSTKIGYEHTKIQLYASKPTGVGQAIHSRSNLSEMLGLVQYNYSRQNLIYYELLDISLLELEQKKYIKCIFLETPAKEIHHSILIDKSATIAKLVELILEKMDIGPEKVGLYRAYEVVQSRKTRDLGLNDLLTSTNDYATVTVELMPEIELKVMDGVLQGRVVEVFHFQKETFRAHGTPFNFVVVDEEFIDTKERLFQRLGMPRKEFERIKICIVPKVGKYVYLADGSLTIDVDDKILDFRPENGEFFLGLDHIDKGRRTGGVGVKIN